MVTVKIKADIAGTISKVIVHVGSVVAEDETLILLESMKMEMPVVAPRAGRVSEIRAAEGETVSEGDVLMLLEG